MGNSATHFIVQVQKQLINSCVQSTPETPSSAPGQSTAPNVPLRVTCPVLSGNATQLNQTCALEVIKEIAATIAHQHEAQAKKRLVRELPNCNSSETLKSLIDKYFAMLTSADTLAAWQKQNFVDLGPVDNEACGNMQILVHLDGAAQVVFVNVVRILRQEQEALQTNGSQLLSYSVVGFGLLLLFWKVASETLKGNAMFLPPSQFL